MHKRYEEVRKELGRLGAQYEIEVTSKHTKLYLEHDGQKRMVVMSLSPSDGRATKNQIRDIRKALSSMGMNVHGG